MQCNSCGSKWESINIVTNCPFCGNILNITLTENMDLSSAIKRAVSEYGVDIFNNKRMLIALISDWVKGFEKEKKLLKIVADNGIFTYIYELTKNNDSEKILLISKIKNKLVDEAFLSENNATLVLNILLDSIGVEPIQNASIMANCLSSDKQQPFNLSHQKTQLAHQNNISITSMLKHADFCLEDGEFKNAEEIFDKIIDVEPENEFAYLGKLMAQNEISKLEEFAKVYFDIESTIAYKRYLRFASEENKNSLLYFRNVALNNKKKLAFKPIGIRIETTDDQAYISNSLGYSCFNSSRVKTIKYYFEFEANKLLIRKLAVRWKIVSEKNPNFVNWQEDSYIIKPTFTYISNGWKFNNVGSWIPGKYTVILEINNEATYQKTFYVN